MSLWYDRGDRLFAKGSGWKHIIPGSWYWLQGFYRRRDNKPLSDLGFRVLELLWWKARDSDRARASYTYIANALGKGRKNLKSVKRALKELEEAGYIVRHTRQHMTRSNQKDTNEYDVTPSRKFLVELLEAFQSLQEGRMTSKEMSALKARSRLAYEALTAMDEEDRELIQMLFSIKEPIVLPGLPEPPPEPEPSPIVADTMRKLRALAPKEAGDGHFEQTQSSMADPNGP
jgi:hypothetical protein